MRRPSGSEHAGDAGDRVGAAEHRPSSQSQRTGALNRLPLAPLALALALALVACGGAPAPVDRNPPNEAILQAARTGLATGDTPPALAGPGLLGGSVDLSALRGRPVLVNFWASSCIPCEREFPLIASALASEARLAVVGVAVLDRREDATRFLKEHDAAWDSILDRDAKVALRWRVRVLPVTYAISEAGTVADRQFGELTRPALERMLRAARSPA